MAWADYFWPNSTVLRNKLGITEADDLHDAEYRLAAMRGAEITTGLAPIAQTYDAEHLKALHRWLFQDLYDWAGLIRDVPISKMTEFAPLDRIETCLQDAADVIAETRWEGLSDERFASAAAEVFAWTNWAHPFRDGNGRATRAFIDAVAGKAGRWLDHSAVFSGCMGPARIVLSTGSGPGSIATSLGRTPNCGHGPLTRRSPRSAGACTRTRTGLRLRRRALIRSARIVEAMPTE